jgi:cob(I)alamin adenosyltransferase
MKIYTKTGDKGTTSLLGGKRVPKDHIRIETYGTVDELIAHLGVVRDHVKGKFLLEDLVRIQDNLMTCAAILATDPADTGKKDLKLSPDQIVWLEKKIDEMEENLEPLTHFILPGGHPVVSFVHVARTVCRRAERRIVSLSETTEVPEVILLYFNRLSDYLFVLSRQLLSNLGGSEIPW